jgi:hypothetical protein
MNPAPGCKVRTDRPMCGWRDTLLRKRERVRRKRKESVLGANDMCRGTGVAKTEHVDLPSRCDRSAIPITCLEGALMEAASRFARRAQGRLCTDSRALGLALFLIFFLLPIPQTLAARLGGATTLMTRRSERSGPARSSPGARLQRTATASRFSARLAYSISVRRWSWAPT